MRYEKVIIIGAPRSGTNMLRDVLCRLPGFGTWPCDEINYIWRHGNARRDTDEFPPELATPRVQAYLQRQFDRRARVGSLSHVVEKTCANSLRVPFIRRALPEAHFLFIHRDPMDVIPSAMKRWRAPLDLGYTLEKVRFVPWTDLPYYGWRFIANRFYRFRSGDRRVASWGPRFDGMKELLQSASLPEICATQWSACVERSVHAFQDIEPGKAQLIRYEDFVAAPEPLLRQLIRRFDLPIDSGLLAEAVRSVSPDSVGRGQRSLGSSDRERVLEITTSARSALESLTKDFARSSN